MMQNKIYCNIIVEPSEELVPSIHIPPITNSVLDYTNPTVSQIHSCEDYLANRFGNYYILPKARTAIGIALNHYNLCKEDAVTILTTTGNYYVSSCVTNEIEKICRWNRIVTSETKVILVIHEFGYPYEGIEDLRNYGLPIIEDCAYAFMTKKNGMGHVGDFVIYSLPKFFTLQMGGILKSNVGEIAYKEDASIRDYVVKRLSTQIDQLENFRRQRLENWSRLSVCLNELGAQPWQITDGIVPGVMLFYWNENYDYSKLKSYMQYHGVESSVFYGRNAFFVPCHHLLTESEIDYIHILLINFQENSKCIK